MTAEQTTISHEELVATTAELCLRILDSKVSKPPEKAALTKILLETTHCNPGEVKLAMEAKLKHERTRNKI